MQMSIGDHPTMVDRTLLVDANGNAMWRGASRYPSWCRTLLLICMGFEVIAALPFLLALALDFRSVVDGSFGGYVSLATIILKPIAAGIALGAAWRGAIVSATWAALIGCFLSWVAFVPNFLEYGFRTDGMETLLTAGFVMMPFALACTGAAIRKRWVLAATVLVSLPSVAVICAMLGLMISMIASGAWRRPHGPPVHRRTGRQFSARPVHLERT